MFSRREFLAISGAVGAEAGLSSCCPKGPTGPGVRAREMERYCEGVGEKDPLWGAGLRAQFRVLRCLTASMLAVPVFEKTYAADVHRRFLKLDKELESYTYSRTIAEAWRLFYELTSRLHEYRNAKSSRARIPVYAYNGHQHAARMWIDESRRKRLGPLVHFDTHDDMRALNKPGKIDESVAKVKVGGQRRKEGLRGLITQIHDHATPVSGGVLGVDFKDVVWCFPYWAYASEFGRRPSFYADVPHGASPYGTFRLLHDKGEDKGRTLPTYSTMPWAETSSLKRDKLRGMSHVRPFRLSLIKTYPSTELFEEGERWKALLRAVPRGPFVLDIDIDYLMSIDSAAGFHRNPDAKGRSGARQRELAVDEYERRLKKGRKLLGDRLVAFRRVLTKIRDAGRIPSMVTIADSTYMPFASTFAGKGYWEYTPYEFAAYLHWKMRFLLADVFKAQGIDAGV